VSTLVIVAAVEIDLRVRKWDVVDSLRRQIDAQSYAQIVSNSTSYEMLQRPELNEFGSITAYMYASDFQRVARPEIEHLPTLEQIEATVRRNRVRADIVFADPWHTYDDSLRVLRLAYDMLTPGGYLVVHDCNPDQPEYTVSLPESCHACWCGETWRAFLDFTANLPESTEWWVLSCDLGVGVVRAPVQERGRHRRLHRRSRFTTMVPDATFEEKWGWLDARRDEVLRLVSVEQWHERTR
jgi:SAM-dependent methyltransferase